MKSKSSLQLAAKCLPNPKILKRIESAKINAVELYTNAECLKKVDIVSICNDFPLSYVVHAPNDIVAPKETFKLAQAIGANVVVTHDIYWEDEWPEVVKIALNTGISLAIENIDGLFTFEKVLLRYGVKRCLDFEHAIFLMRGFYPEGLKNFYRRLYTYIYQDMSMGIRNIIHTFMNLRSMHSGC